VSHEFDDFATESAHAKKRDRKHRGPKVVMVNPGLRTVTAQLAHSLKTRNAEREMQTTPGER